jgi:hypothetical protein
MEGYFYDIILKNSLPSRIWYASIETLRINMFMRLAFSMDHFIKLGRGYERCVEIRDPNLSNGIGEIGPA